MKTKSALFSLACSVAAFATTATAIAADQQTPVVASGAEIKKLASDFRFVEGPVADRDGSVYFSDIPNRRIHKWSLDGTVKAHRENSGGANGLYFDLAGRLVACEGQDRQVTADDLKGNITILAKEFDGKRLNSPNDLWIDPKGGIYFSDPRYGNRDGMEQDGEHVYYLLPDRTQLVRVGSDLKRPNGLIGTPDGKKLYIADAGDNKTWQYDIRADGTLAGKELFCESGSDGMTLDERGNVYLTAGEVLVFDPSGNRITSIKVPERPANVTFAGREGRMLFITARTSIYSLDMAVRGASATSWQAKP